MLFDKKTVESQQNKHYGMNLDLFYPSIGGPEWNVDVEIIKKDSEDILLLYSIYQESKDIEDYAFMLEKYNEAVRRRSRISIYIRTLLYLDVTNQEAKEAYKLIMDIDAKTDEGINLFQDLIDFSTVEFDALILSLETKRFEGIEFLRRVRGGLFTIDPKEAQFFQEQVEKHATLHNSLPENVCKPIYSITRDERRKNAEKKILVRPIVNEFGKLMCEGMIQHLCSAKKSGFESVLARSASSSGIHEKELLHTMKTIEDHSFIYRNYLSKKAELLGLNDFSIYDISTPLGDTHITLSSEQMMNICIRFGYFIHPRVGEFIHSLFEEGRVQTKVLPNKRHMSYCDSSTNGVWIFVNSEEPMRLRTLTILFHEFGHALHGKCREDYRDGVYNLNCFLESRIGNETFSIFFEIMSFYFMRETDLLKEIKDACLFHQYEKCLDKVFTPIEDMNLELRLERALSKGCEPTGEEMSAWYYEECGKLLGDVIQNLEAMRYNWTTIPHFVDVVYYNYPYALAALNALILADIWEEDKEKFIRHFFALLAERNSENYAVLIKRHFGVNVNDPEQILRAFNRLKSMQQKLP